MMRKTQEEDLEKEIDNESEEEEFAEAAEEDDLTADDKFF